MQNKKKGKLQNQDKEVEKKERRSSSRIVGKSTKKLKSPSKQIFTRVEHESGRVTSVDIASTRATTLLNSRQGHHSSAYSLFARCVEVRCKGLNLEKSIKVMLDIIDKYTHQEEAHAIFTYIKNQIDADQNDYLTDAEEALLIKIIEDGLQQDNSALMDKARRIIQDRSKYSLIFSTLIAHHLTLRNKLKLATFPPEGNVDPDGTIEEIIFMSSKPATLDDIKARKVYLYPNDSKAKQVSFSFTYRCLTHGHHREIIGTLDLDTKEYADLHRELMKLDLSKRTSLNLQGAQKKQLVKATSYDEHSYGREDARIRRALDWLCAIQESNDVDLKVSMGEAVEHIQELFWHPRIPQDVLFDLTDHDSRDEWEKICRAKGMPLKTLPRSNNLDELARVIENHFDTLFSFYPKLITAVSNIRELVQDFCEKLADDKSEYGWNLSQPEYLRNSLTRVVSYNLLRLRGWHQETLQGARTVHGMTPGSFFATPSRPRKRTNSDESDDDFTTPKKRGQTILDMSSQTPDGDISFSLSRKPSGSLSSSSRSASEDESEENQKEHRQLSCVAGDNRITFGQFYVVRIHKIELVGDVAKAPSAQERKILIYKIKEDYFFIGLSPDMNKPFEGQLNSNAKEIVAKLKTALQIAEVNKVKNEGNEKILRESYNGIAKYIGDSIDFLQLVANSAALSLQQGTTCQSSSSTVIMGMRKR